MTILLFRNIFWLNLTILLPFQRKSYLISILNKSKFCFPQPYPLIS